MSRWRALLGLERGTPEQRRRLGALPPPLPPNACRLARDRLVVLDLETTGLDVRRDRILSAGAVVIEGGALDLGQQFERTVRRAGPRTLANVLIHGLSPSRLAEGEPEEAVLLDLLEFIGTSPVFAFHAPFDQAMLRRSLRRKLGYRMSRSFIDVAPLALALAPGEPPRQAGLDQWLERYGLAVASRHNAAADALATAELLLILLSYARREGLNTLAELTEHGRLQSRLAGMRSPG